MLNDSIGTITERIVNNFGKDELRLLREWKFTAADINKLDGDRYAFLVATRGEEVQGILDAPTVTAKRKAAKTGDELAIFYAECRNGKHSRNEIAKWLAENFEDDFDAFNRDFPQVAGEQIPSNMTAITADIAARRVYPTYSELVTSFGRLAVPAKGYPTITLLCPDGQHRSGYELAQAIKRWPLELLEPSKSTNRPAYETQSATEFLATDPALKSVKTEQPLLLRERFNREWGNFLVGDIGRALAARADQHGLGSFLPGWMWEHMVKNQIPFHQKGFEQSALAVVSKITIHEGDDAAPLELSHDDIGGAKSGNFILHDGGGDHQSQLPLGLSMAGQRVESQYNPDHVWTEQSLRRELRRLSADEYKERLSDKAFVTALNRYKLL